MLIIIVLSMTIIEHANFLNPDIIHNYCNLTTGLDLYCLALIILSLRFGNLVEVENSKVDGGL